MKRLRRWVLRWAVGSAFAGGGLRRDASAMTEAEMRQALAVPDSHPQLRALMTILDAHVEDAMTTTRATQTASNPGLLAHEAGGLDALLSLRETIAAVREGGADGEKWG
jgi:hypothetical protein